MKKRKMPELCRFFKICYFNLCPLDEELEFRTYFPSDPEQFCRLIRTGEIQKYLTRSELKNYEKIVNEKKTGFEDINDGKEEILFDLSQTIKKKKRK